MDPAIIATVVLGSVALVAVASGLRVIREYERGVVLRLGRRGPVLSPGLRAIFPFGIDRLLRVDLRATSVDITGHEVISRDGVPVRVSVTAQYQVLNPLLAVTRVVDYRAATTALVGAALRDVVSRSGLRDLLVDQDSVRAALTLFVDARSEPWGVRVTAVDVQGVELPDALRRAMARQAEALGSGASATDDPHHADLETANRLADAAELLAAQPVDVQVQFLRALSEVGSGGSTLVVVPLPQDLVQPFVDLQGRATSPRIEDPGGGTKSERGEGQPGSG